MGSLSCEHEVEDESMVLFLPIGRDISAKALVRLRFKPVEHFRDSLPLKSESSVSQNTGLVFLCWNRPVSGDGKELDIDKSISDWRSRVAEVNYVPAQYRPYCIIHAFGLPKEREEDIVNFTKQQKIKIASTFFEDDAEDTVVDALQAMADHTVERQVQGGSASVGVWGKIDSDATVKQADKKSSCGCMLL